MLNYSNYKACTSSSIFNPAKCKFMQFSYFFLVNIWINKVIKLGQIVLNILVRVPSDSLIKSILKQNNIKISKAGDGFYDFMTLLNDSKTTLSLC